MSAKRRSRLRDLAEYAFMRGLELAAWPIPVGLGLRLGRALGSFARLVDRRHRRVGEHNAAWALGLTPEQARALIRKVYRNFGANLVEDLMMPKILRWRALDEFSEAEGIEHLRAALAKGRGAIVITGHFGNWELAGLAMAHFAGKAMAVARPMPNPLVEAHTLRWRERAGLTVASRRGALRRVVQYLRAGGCVGMLIDQNQRSGGVFVPFFGKLAATVPSPARIALKYHIPVLAGYTRRKGDGSFHCFHCDPPFDLIRTADHEADVLANTALFTRRIEDYIRQHPDQWFWLHSRWRKRPPEEEQAAGPPGAAQETSPDEP